MAPGSPFHLAASELFIDAALRGITVLSANGDGGSGNEVGNGVTNVGISRTSATASWWAARRSAPFTRRAGRCDAGHDHSTPPLAGDHATIWTLIAGGLTALPDAANGGATLVETVWNNYFVDGDTLTGPGNQPVTCTTMPARAASTPASPRRPTRRISASRR